MFNYATLFRDLYVTLRNPAAIQTTIFYIPLKFAVRKCIGEICFHSRVFKNNDLLWIYILSQKTGR